MPQVFDNSIYLSTLVHPLKCQENKEDKEIKEDINYMSHVKAREKEVKQESFTLIVVMKEQT